MFKLSSSIFILLFVPLIAKANIKACVAAMTVARTGSLTLTQGEAMDTTGLPGNTLAQIIKSLKGQWIQIGTREIFPTFGKNGSKKNFMLRVLDIGERYQFGRTMLVVVGALGETNRGFIPTEIFINDITSIQLIDVPEITVSLVPNQKSNGVSNRLDERILTLAEGDSDASLILAKLSDAKYPKIHDRDGTYESFLALLDSQNIGGRQLVVAYRDYAKQNIRDLILGVINNPREVAQTINKTLGSNYDPEPRILIRRSN